MTRTGPDHCLRCASEDAVHRAVIRTDPPPHAKGQPVKTEVRYCDRCWRIVERPGLPRTGTA